MAELAGSGASLADFIWKNAEDLWGDFKHTDFGKIILPFTLLRRLECVLEKTRQEVRDAHAAHKESGIDLDLILRQTTRYPFYNTSEYELATLGGTKTRQNLQDYIAHFSDNARVIFEQFDFTNTVIRLDKAGVLFKICKNFAAVDLHPNVVPDRVMSNLYEHLIRRFGAEVNEGAEDFMTPRDVVHLATALVLDPDDELFEANPGLIRTLYDPTCGTGGFLVYAMEYLQKKYTSPEGVIEEEIENADDRHHEVPYTRMNGDRSETGYIDLLYRKGEEWFVVDFKTDMIRSEEQHKELVGKYSRQLERYASAIKQLLGQDAKLSICFLDNNGRTHVTNQI